jgi:16S rRNA (cytosine967-C5)-methyltransferase
VRHGSMIKSASRSPQAAPAREIALDVLKSVRGGRFAEHALSDRLQQETVSAQDRGLATELVYGVLRWRDRLDSIIQRCLQRPEKRLQADVREILRIALYQLVLLDKIPNHAAVDQAAVQSRARCGNQSVGFVNAVLRNAVRNLRAVDPQPEDDIASLATFFSHPAWLVGRWVEHFGPRATRRILDWNNTPAPLELRVNRLKSTPEQVTELMKRQGVTVQQIPGLEDGLRISSLNGPVAALQGYAEGFFSVQGSASQMVAPLLKPAPGDRILDACAAPGGKTAHLAALTANRARITATDVDRSRVDETRKNLERLGVQGVEVMRGDATNSEFISGLGKFDRILLDAVCSNLGVLRHNPEAKYRLGPDAPGAFGKVQVQMLDATAAALKPGGILLYSVCTGTSQETRQVTEQFLQVHPEFAPVPIDPREVLSEDFIDSFGFLDTFAPSEAPRVDGFFAARFCRRGAD